MADPATTAADPANAGQIAFWNGDAGQRWTRHQRRIDAAHKAFADAALARLAARPGERIVDVGCGSGATTLALAEAVQGHGFVLGVDVSRPLLGLAAARAGAIPEYPIRLVEADAGTYPFEPAAFDALFSRFGVMFFADPAAAFANMRRTLKPGGRCVFACWRERRENAWVRVPAEVARRLVELPPAPPPHEPGPFAFADAARVRGILERAGFAEIGFEKCDAPMPMGDTAAAAASYLVEVGPVATVLHEKNDAALTERVRVALAAELAARGAGPVTLGGAVWIVSARAPA
jgi:SAM-dependent methyltransferase